MHRSIQVAVQSGKTLLLLEELKQQRTVIGLNVNYNASVKPAGDVVQIYVLNRGVDDVLRIVQSHTVDDNFSIATAEISSLNAPEHQKLINDDIDEAIWEEMETGLRHNGHITSNFLILMAMGGAISALGFVVPAPEQALAFVAASIIAPGLEPLAKIPLGISLRSKDVLIAGLKASIAGYFVLMLSAAVTFNILIFTGSSSADEFLSDLFLQSLTKFQLKGMLISLSAAIASITMYLAYRRNVIAGPLVVLVIIPAVAGAAISLTIGQMSMFVELMGRFATDFLLILVSGIILIALKQKLVHKRKTLR